LGFLFFDHAGFLLVTDGSPHAGRSVLSVNVLIVHPQGGRKKNLSKNSGEVNIPQGHQFLGVEREI